MPRNYVLLGSTLLLMSLLTALNSFNKGRTLFRMLGELTSWETGVIGASIGIVCLAFDNPLWGLPLLAAGGLILILRAPWAVIVQLLWSARDRNEDTWIPDPTSPDNPSGDYETSRRFAEMGRGTGGSSPSDRIFSDW